jgi:hypothetical protein
MIAHRSIECTTHRSTNCSLIHCLHHPSLFQLLSDPSLAPLIAPPIAPWSTACITHRSFKIHVLHHPSLLLSHPGPSLVPPIASFITPWSTPCTTHRSLYCSLVHRLIKFGDDETQVNFHRPLFIFWILANFTSNAPPEGRVKLEFSKLSTNPLIECMRNRSTSYDKRNFTQQ